MIYYLWFIQFCVLMKTEGINLLLLTISAYGHLDELQKAEKSLWTGFTVVGSRYIDGLVQDCSTSITNTPKLLQSCTKSLKWDDIREH